MYERKEDFGYMVEHSADYEMTKKIELQFRDNVSGKEMVRQAVRIAKRYGAVITKPLEYFPDPSFGGRKIFEMKCSKYRYHLDGGKPHLFPDKKVTERDIEDYKNNFGTDTCIDRSFKKKYWYTDNWYGNTREFPSLKAAKKAASQETGMCVWIYTNHPYGRPSELIFKSPASGITPP